MGNVWLPQTAPAVIAIPDANYLALFISDGTGGTVAKSLYSKDPAGTVAALVIAYTDEQAQDAVGSILTDSATVDFTYDDAGNTISAIVPDGAITNAKLANMAQATFKMRAAAAGTGIPIDGTAAQAKTALAIANTDVSGLGTLSTQNGTFSGTHSGASSGTNTGDQTITLTGDVTGSGTGSFAATIAAGAVTLADMANLAQSRLVGRAAGAGNGVPQALTAAQIATILGLAISPARDYGVTFDHRVVFDGACSTGANTKITSATAAFVAADNGKRIVLATAGASSAPYVGTITAIDSATQVTVSPAISTTASAKGLQIHTDDLAAWNTLVTDVNAFSRGGAHIVMDARVGTQRSGISGDINTFTKAITLEGFGSSYNHDVGDYSAIEGVCIAYAGATQSTNGTFGAVLTFAPTSGVSNPAMGGPVLRNFWIDCRNGDQNPGLGGIELRSCHGAVIDTVFVMDPGAYGLLTGVVTPGTSTSLGEDRGTDRCTWMNFRVRALENAFIGANTAQATLTPTTTSSTVTLSTSTQSLTIAAANGLSPSGYVWVMTENGYPVLVNYTGGGGTTTLTGCAVSLADAQNIPKTLSGSNVVQAVPNNAIVACLDGDLTHNTNLSVGMLWQCSTGTNWGPAAIEFRNSDSVELIQVVINGGNNTNDGAINRIRRPGVRFNGSDSNVGFPARNNVMRSGDPGAGGCSSMGLKGGGAKMAFPAGPNIWDRLQLGNAAPIPVEEAFSCLVWDGNGALPPGESGVVSVAQQTIAAAALTLLNGSLIALPPQWCQAGTTLRWTIMGATTVGAAAAAVFAIRLGPLGTTADPVVFTPTLPVGAAGTIGFKLVLEIVVRVPGVPPTAVTSRCHAIIHNGNTGAVTGIINLAQVQFTGAGTAFNAQTSGLLYAHVSYTGGAGVTVAFEQVECEVIKCSNP